MDTARYGTRQRSVSSGDGRQDIYRAGPFLYNKLYTLTKTGLKLIYSLSWNGDYYSVADRQTDAVVMLLKGRLIIVVHTLSLSFMKQNWNHFLLSVLDTMHCCAVVEWVKT